MINASVLFFAVGGFCWWLGQVSDRTWFTNGGLIFILISILFFIASYDVKQFGKDFFVSKIFIYLNNTVANPLSSFFMKMVAS